VILPFLGEDGPVLFTFHGTDADRWDFFPVESSARVVKYTRWLRFIPCAVGSKYTEVERVEEVSGFRLLSERVESVVQYAE
jgi:predicted esterase